MICLDMEEPKNTFDCPFLEEDAEDNSLWCYLIPCGDEARCRGLYKENCLIKKQSTT